MDRTGSSRGAAAPEPVRAEGCPPDRAQGQAGKGKGQGRPDDPGSQANGQGSHSQVPGEAPGGTDGSKETDGEEHGNSGEAGKVGDAGVGRGHSAENAGKGAEQGSAGHATRADTGNSG